MVGGGVNHSGASKGPAEGPGVVVVGSGRDVSTNYFYNFI